MVTFYNALHHFTGSKVNHNFPQHTHTHSLTMIQPALSSADGTGWSIMAMTGH